MNTPQPNRLRKIQAKVSTLVSMMMLKTTRAGMTIMKLIMMNKITNKSHRLELILFQRASLKTILKVNTITQMTVWDGRILPRIKDKFKANRVTLGSRAKRRASNL